MIYKFKINKKGILDMKIIKTNLKEKGITLIALVITIIIILILAGISIMTLTGENGLINKTISAKEENEMSAAKEELKLAIESLKVNYYEENANVTMRDYILNNEDAIEEALGNGSDVEVNGQDLEYQNFKFELDEEGNLTQIENKAFDPEEWDKTAADYSCFYWESDDSNNEGYGTVIGYTSKIDNYTVLRFPSRCTKIEFKGINGTDNYADGRTVNQSRAFTNNILKVEIPSTVNTIGKGAFRDLSYNPCFSKVTTFRIENGLKTIEQDAFCELKGLTNITIPDSVTSIEQGAFSYCKNLKNIKLSSNLTSIGREAFWRCSSLTSIVIPNSVTSIGDACFWYCDNLTKIYIPQTVTLKKRTIGEENGIFLGCPDSLHIYTDAKNAQSIWEGKWNWNGTLDLTVDYNTTLEQYKAL